MKHLGEEGRVVHEDAVDALLVGVEEADVLAKHVDDARRVPRIRVLVIPANYNNSG